jgi:AcrR family transcriptional regulator
MSNMLIIGAMAGIKQYDEDQALERAMHVFWQRGYAATSMQDLAKATGVLRGSLYHAYGDKRAIFLLAYARYQRLYLGKVHELLQAPDAAQALRAYFAYVIASMREPVVALGEALGEAAPSSATRGCLTTKIATDETAMDEEVRAALRGMLAGLAGELEARLAQPDAASRLRLPPKETARLLLTFTRGNVVMERIYHGPEELMATAEDFIRLLFKDA